MNDVARRTRYLLTSLYLCMGVIVLSGAWQYRALRFFETPGWESQGTTLNFIFKLSTIFQVFVGFTVVVTGILFVRWMSLSYQTLIDRGMSGLRYTRSQVVWSFFLPIIQFFRPYRVITEIYQANKAFYEGEAEEWRFQKPQPLFLVWWLAFLFGDLFARAFGVVGFIFTDASEGVINSFMGIASSFFHLWAAYLFLSVIQTVRYYQAEPPPENVKTNVDIPRPRVA